MLSKNADRDPYLRHAGVMALAKCADAAALAAAAKEDNRSVRLAALLAYAQLGSAETGGFLRDKDAEIVARGRAGDQRRANHRRVSGARSAAHHRGDGDGNRPDRTSSLSSVR